MRDIDEAGAFEVTIAHEHRDAVDLSWSPVPSADAYRLVFLGADLTEVAHLDVPNGTRLELRRGALPSGAPSGTRVAIEVVALRLGAPIATTPTRAVLLP
jgi:hypothetical protein